MSDQAMRAVGVLTARVILGLIFGMAGYWKTFELTPIGHAQKLFIVPYASTWIPIWMLWTVGTVIPVVEFAAGWMVVVGWRVRECLVALALILMTVTYGHLLIEPLFNFNGHVIPRTLMLLVVAFLPRDADWYPRLRSRGSSSPPGMALRTWHRRLPRAPARCWGLCTTCRPSRQAGNE